MSICIETIGLPDGTCAGRRLRFEVDPGVSSGKWTLHIPYSQAGRTDLVPDVPEQLAWLEQQPWARPVYGCFFRLEGLEELAEALAPVRCSVEPVLALAELFRRMDLPESLERLAELELDHPELFGPRGD